VEKRYCLGPKVDVTPGGFSTMYMIVLEGVIVRGEEVSVPTEEIPRLSPYVMTGLYAGRESDKGVLVAEM